MARIDKRLQAGDIDEAVAGLLRATHQANDEGRFGAIHFALTPEALCDWMGVQRLFSSWGGEALYNSHESDGVTGPALQSIGEPRLVTARLPISEVRSFQEVGKSIYRFYMNSKGVVTRIGYGCEGTLRRPLLSTEIDAIHSFGDAEFKQLTRCETWPCPLA